MTDFTNIDPTQIKDGLLLNEDQTNYIAMAIKDATRLLRSLRESLDSQTTRDPSNLKLKESQKFFKKLESDLKYCVTILRKDHVL